MMFQALLLKGLVAGVGVLALVLFVVMAIKHIEGRGYDKAEAKYKPQVQQLTFDRDTALASNKNLFATIQSLQESVNALRKKEEEARTEATAALARAKARQVAMEQEINNLRAIALGPPTGENTCNEADAILRNLLAGRMRHN
jgi:molybdopterin converting factor small subunit